MELMDEMLCLFEAVADEDAFALIVDLKHVVFSLLSRPSEDFLEDVSDVFHKVYRIIPANDQVTSFVGAAGFFFWPFGWQDQWFRGRWHHKNVRRDWQSFQPSEFRVTRLGCVLIYRRFYGRA